MMEVNVVKAEKLQRGWWIFTERDQQKPVQIESVSKERDRHGQLIRVTDAEGRVYIFRPDLDDTVEVIV
jgi:hypothetical protein